MSGDTDPSGADLFRQLEALPKHEQEVFWTLIANQETWRGTPLETLLVQVAEMTVAEAERAATSGFPLDMEKHNRILNAATGFERVVIRIGYEAFVRTQTVRELVKLQPEVAKAAQVKEAFTPKERTAALKQKVVKLRDEDKKSFGQIGQELGMTRNNAEQIYARAKGKRK